MEVYKFNGTNEKLFTRSVIQDVSPKTTLLVPETHSAIILKDGEMLQTLSKGKYTLGDLFDVEKDATLEVIFVSRTAKLKLLWGTPNKITIFDPVLKGSYSLGMSGDFEVQVGDPRKCFLYLVGADEVLTSDALQDRLMSKVVSVVEEELVKFINENKVIYQDIYLHKQEISNLVKPKLSNIFSQDYGINVVSFNIANIIFDEKDISKLGSEKKIKLCPKCGAELNENARFCTACGFKLESKKECLNCHAQNPPEARYCLMCGQKLE